MARHKDDHLVKVRLQAGSQAASATILVRYWSPERAKRRGFYFCGVVYLLGLLSNINILLHFFLPPIWLIIGPYLGYKMYQCYQNTFELRAGEGECPQCEGLIKVVPYGLSWPFYGFCPRCACRFMGDSMDELPAYLTRQSPLNRTKPQKLPRATNQT